ncbi:putative ATP-dependent DNA helicase DinG [Nostoc commune NIES-4072]|uniref:Putative ATP-dependent DNA helicase DinG n=1 Tax=Nostoc commune NIES-4072 TaxID=2005467 RepID=A0A2R5FFA6_NOSCO|nr:ATP-dependent DNA helicase [Nostoc commune]BBD65950.1 putative ATP-dependent DNA helicase DinG [Nostoc commune HK-02]GBG16725.1 putative ATP-dependent DNA helicase DinG [Nostoc commune NIES-4072]
MIEAEVHFSLHNFLRSQAGFPSWPHHLTMARLVARALRLGRSALIQVGAVCGYQGRYRTSFVASALMWHGPVIIVAQEAVQQLLLRVEIPRLQQWLPANKAIRTGDAWPSAEFQGLLLTSPEAWLKGQFAGGSCFPQGIPTIIDGVDDLEDWVRHQLTQDIQPDDWEQLILACPNQAEAIREARIQLTHQLFQHPVNPYQCYLISQPEIEILSRLYLALDQANLPDNWKNFWQQFQTLDENLSPPASPASPALFWATIAHRQGLFSLHYAPMELGEILSPIWQRQPVVLIGSAIEPETEAPLFRERLGLDDLTCLKFSADQAEAIQLYVPYKLPLPNTPEFQAAFIHKVRTLVCLSATAPGLTVVLVGDVPLKSQVATILASEFGSRVQVEKTCLDENGILISGWEFWREHQRVLPAPHLLIIATLPLPSLENPLVAGRVARYKRSHQDWFRLYLLPAALSELQRAIAPVRESQGIVALLDSRVVNRSYGAQILAALSPLARINYLDPNLFSNTDEENSA